MIRLTLFLSVNMIVGLILLILLIQVAVVVMQNMSADQRIAAMRRVSLAVSRLLIVEQITSFLLI